MNDKTSISELRVVVVDDSDFSRSLISRMVTESGHQVVGEAADAETAMKIIKEKSPNVVITDIVMPEISGIELTEQINKSFDDISVIVVSSLSQEHIVLEAIGAGAADFIPKPIQKQQLADSLDKIQTQISKK
ncbi:MAG TPA: response regulator [Bacteriovoracaceae bacterium]|nr:response regulator [Bacteriovoracaceae bacterium]